MRHLYIRLKPGHAGCQWHRISTDRLWGWVLIIRLEKKHSGSCLLTFCFLFHYVFCLVKILEIYFLSVLPHQRLVPTLGATVRLFKGSGYWHITLFVKLIIFNSLFGLLLEKHLDALVLARAHAGSWLTPGSIPLWCNNTSVLVVLSAHYDW